jgi:hypothetical protein
MDTMMVYSYQQRLVESIQAKQALSPRVAEAFLKIPRHPFVPSAGSFPDYIKRADLALLREELNPALSLDYYERIGIG